jgi:hypothetical protein
LKAIGFATGSALAVACAMSSSQTWKITNSDQADARDIRGVIRPYPIAIAMETDE